MDRRIKFPFDQSCLHRSLYCVFVDMATDGIEIPPIPVERYHDADFFALEQEHICCAIAGQNHGAGIWPALVTSLVIVLRFTASSSTSSRLTFRIASTWATKPWFRRSQASRVPLKRSRLICAIYSPVSGSVARSKSSGSWSRKPSPPHSPADYGRAGL